MKVKNKKKFIALSLVILLAAVMLTTVEAAVTKVSGSGSSATVSLETSRNIGETLASGVLGLLGDILGFAISGVFSFITPLINGLAIVIITVLFTIFSTGFGEHIPPLPDNIVFNKIPVLDANFVNPHTNSLINKIGGSFIGDLFMSLQTIAITVFIIAAMVTGLKIALSTIAAKRAQYKQVAMKWLTGFIILLTLRWILAGVFLINETLVAQFARIAKASDFSIRVVPTLPIPIIGKLLSEVIGGVTKFITGNRGIPVPGYLGLILFSLFEGFTGDIVASIVGFVIVGQASVVLGSYFKRLFMCLLLGVISPLMVAVDTIVAVSGGQSQIFKSWLKNFIFTVFTQSFHAAYMVVAFRLMNRVTNISDVSSTLASIIVVTLTTGLVKMEKMLKGMFGFGDSMGGSLADGKKSMKKAMGAVAGLAAAAKSLGDNRPKEAAAKQRRQAFAAEKAHLKERTAFQSAKEAKANGNMDEYRRQMKIAADARKEAKANGSTGNTRIYNNYGAGGAGGAVVLVQVDQAAVLVQAEAARITYNQF